jgi:hypothetical protein
MTDPDVEIQPNPSGTVPMSLMLCEVSNAAAPSIPVLSDAGHAAIVAAVGDLDVRDQSAYSIRTLDGHNINNPFLMMWKPGHGPIPTHVVADGAEGLPNGVKQVVPTAKRLTCFPHFSRKVSEEYTSEMDEEEKGDVLEDIAMISSLFTVDAFDVGLKLFEAKWKGKEERGVKGVNKALGGIAWWCQPHNRGWSVAHGEGVALPNNNPIESTNKNIKLEITDWRQKTVIAFLNGMMSWYESESRRRMPGHPGGVRVRIPTHNPSKPHPHIDHCTPLSHPPSTPNM